MRLSKKALAIIDAAQYRAYGLGYRKAVYDMQAWLTASLPNVVVAKVDALGRDAAKSLEIMNECHYGDVSRAAREHVAELHRLLGVDE